jgi:membrane fusion protein, multidrug efflux system
MKKRNTIIAAVVVACLVLLFAFLATKSKKSSSPVAPGAVPAGQAPSAGSAKSGGASSAKAKWGGASAAGSSSEFSVRLEKAKRQTLQTYLSLNGDVEAETNIDVYADIAGKLANLKVDLGSSVEKGQAVAQVDPSKPGESYALSSVYSPISGTVTAVNVQVGATVSTSTSIVTVGKIDKLEIVAKVPERDVSGLKEGLPAVATFEAYPGEKFYTTIYKVNPVVDSASRTKEIRLRFNKPDSRVNAGMFAKLVVYTEAYPNTLVITEDAILIRNDQSIVFVVKDDNTVEKRVIQTGISVDGMIEVKDGLTAGENIVLEGQQVLADGSKVKAINADEVSK